MKRVSEIRVGLGRIGALVDTPGDIGIDGPDTGVELTRELYGPDDGGQQNVSFAPNPQGEDEQGLEEEFEPLFEVGPEIEQATAAMGGDAGKAIRESTLVVGVDALGYYMPFHVVGTQWGVYMRTSGLVWMATHVFQRLELPVGHRCLLAFRAILAHELFHFATEVAVAQAELLFAEPWYLKAKFARRQMTPPYLAEEEALANAYMLARFRSARPEMRVRGKQEALKAFTRQQPVGYRDALKIRPGDWMPRLEGLTAQYGAHGVVAATRHDLWNGINALDWASFYPIVPRVPWRYCPLHLVDDLQRIGLPPGVIQHFSRIANIHESDAFLRMLGRLSLEIQRAWARVKVLLGEAITAGADFKPWPPGGKDVYSVRVNRSVRAHLRYHRDERSWTALEIGSHTAMGHG